MPNQQSHLTALDSPGYKIEGWLFLFDRGSPVATYAVDTTPVYPTYDLDVTLSAGSAAAVKQGALYTVETSGGLYKGMGSIRYAGTISAGNLPVRELSRGTIDVEAGDVVKVYRYFLPGEKLVGATSAFNPDGLSYSDQGSAPPPMGNNNGPWAGKTTQLPIPLTDSLGYVVDPDSSSPVTVNRATLPAGLSYNTGNATTLDVTLTGTEGTYWVETPVTDPDNGKSVTRYTPICIDDSPLECTVEPYGGDMDNGWRLTVNFREALVIPQHTIAAFVAKETIVGIDGSFGSASSGRSHIKFLGIVRRLSAEGDGQLQTVSYEFLSPLAWLLETPGFSKVMLDSASPDEWAKLKTLTTKRAKIQIIQFYTNLNQVGYDIIFNSNYRSKRYPGLFLEKNTPIAQLRELADGVGARLACNRQGRFEFFTRPRLLPLASRSGVPTMLTPSLHSITRYSLSQEMKDTVEKIYFSGFVAGASNNAPFRVSYPGKSPGTGTDSPQFEKMICDSITDAEEEAGRRGAFVQMKYVKSTKESLWAHTLDITLFGSFDVFDLYGEWVGMPSLPNKAGIDTSVFRYEIDSIGVEYSGGSGRVNLRLTSETNGVPGQYDPPPVDSPPGLDPFPTTDWWDDLLDDQISFVGSQGLGVRRLLVAGKGGANVAYASDDNGLPSSPTWMDRSTGLSGSAAYWLQVDPWNFGAYFGCFSDGIWWNADLKAGASWVQILDNSRLDSMSHHYHFILLSPYRQGWILAAAGKNHLDISPNYGASWTTVNMSGGLDTRSSTTDDGSNIYECYPELSWHNGVGRLWGGISIGTPPSEDGHKIMIGSAWGSSWSLAATLAAASDESSRVFCPFLRLDGSPNLPDGNQLIIARNGTKGGGNASADVYRSQNAASSFTLVDSSANPYSGQDTPLARGICDYEDLPGVYAFLQRENGGGAGDRRVAFTEDGYQSIQVCANQPTSDDLRDIRCLPSGNKNWLIVFGADGSGVLEVTVDRGNSPWIDATGNLASLWGDTLVSYATAL